MSIVLVWYYVYQILCASTTDLQLSSYQLSLTFHIESSLSSKLNLTYDRPGYSVDVLLFVYACVCYNVGCY